MRINQWLSVLTVLAIGALVLGAAVPVAAQPGPPFGRPMRPGMGHGMGMGGPSIGAGMGGAGVAGPTDVGAWFIQEMIPHHEDAIVMADLALTQAEHPEIRDLAASIMRVQSAEIEQMRGWYHAWYGADVSPAQMEVMMGRMGDDPTSIDGAQPFDKAFIEAMVPHHQMAVMMASMTLIRTDRPELQGLLRSIITSQGGEIEQMRTWYQTWYGTALPFRMHGMH